MKNLKLTLIASLALVGASWATPISVGSEQSLQSILNERTQGGTSSVNVNTDQADPDAYWNITGSTISSATFVIEITGAASTNILGIYDAGNIANKVMLFNGAASTGSKMSLTIDGGNHFRSIDLGIPALIGESYFTGSTFGYYLQQGSDIYYSDKALNAGGIDMMVAFAGKGDKFSAANDGNYATWNDNEFILGWEDYIAGDRDFQDMVVMVESVEPVPEPTTLGLMGLGLIGLVAAARRRNKTV